MESAFNAAREAASEAIDDIDVLAFELEKHAAKDAPYRINSIARQAACFHTRVCREGGAGRLTTLASSLKGQLNAARKNDDVSTVVTSLREIQKILQKAVALPEPNFFRMGYYVAFSGKPLPDMPVLELNEFLGEYLNREFMQDFIADARRALEYSADVSYRNMEEAVRALREGLPVFQKEKLDRSACVRMQEVSRREGESLHRSACGCKR